MLAEPRLERRRRGEPKDRQIVTRCRSASSSDAQAAAGVLIDVLDEVYEVPARREERRRRVLEARQGRDASAKQRAPVLQPAQAGNEQPQRSARAPSAFRYEADDESSPPHQLRRSRRHDAADMPTGAGGLYTGSRMDPLSASLVVCSCGFRGADSRTACSITAVRVPREPSYWSRARCEFAGLSPS
jgi:hypothetical protein